MIRPLIRTAARYYVKPLDQEPASLTGSFVLGNALPEKITSGFSFSLTNHQLEAPAVFVVFNGEK